MKEMIIIMLFLKYKKALKKMIIFNYKKIVLLLIDLNIEILIGVYIINLQGE